MNAEIREKFETLLLRSGYDYVIITEQEVLDTVLDIVRVLLEQEKENAKA